MLEVQTCSVVFRLESPRDRRIERAGSKAIAQKTLWLDREDLTRLLPPRSHIQRESMPDNRFDVTRRPPFRVDFRVRQAPSRPSQGDD